MISFIYDIVWHKMQDYEAEQQQDGGFESTLRTINWWAITIMMFCKIIMAFVYWKVSLDINSFCKTRKLVMK